MPSPQILIKPRSGWVGVNLRELWHYRELLYIFTWRDIKVRYKQTVLGIAWAILQPFMLMVVFSLFFGGLAKIPSDNAPYPIFVYSGLIFWNYFSVALTSSSNSLVENEGIIKKVYFPRLILPLSPMVTPVVDFFIAFLVLVGMMFYYHYTPTFAILLVPLLLGLCFLTAAGLGIFLATVNIRYRDIRYILPFFIQFLLFLTPVIYPATLVPEQFRWILSLNPLTGIIQAARSAVLGTNPINYSMLLLSALIASVIFTFSVLYFRKTERVFADIA